MQYSILSDRHGRTRFVVPIVAAAASYTLWYLEIEGSYEARRALWAHLASRKDRKRRSSETYVTWVSDGETHKVTVDGTVTYHNMWTPTQTVIFHPKFDRFHFEYLFGDPPPYLARAISRIDVPVKWEWIPTLWPEIVKRELVIAATVQTGYSFWQVESNKDRWRKLITDLVKAGELQ